MKANAKFLLFNSWQKNNPRLDWNGREKKKKIKKIV